MSFITGWKRVAGAWLLGLAAVSAHAEPHAVIGILTGAASLVRQTTRYALAEGAVLAEGDIVELYPGVQVGRADELPSDATYSPTSVMAEAPTMAIRLPDRG